MFDTEGRSGNFNLFLLTAISRASFRDKPNYIQSISLAGVTNVDVSNMKETCFVVLVRKIFCCKVGKSKHVLQMFFLCVKNILEHENFLMNNFVLSPQFNGVKDHSWLCEYFSCLTSYRIFVEYPHLLWKLFFFFVILNY